MKLHSSPSTSEFSLSGENFLIETYTLFDYNAFKTEFVDTVFNKTSILTSYKQNMCGFNEKNYINA